MINHIYEMEAAVIIRGVKGVRTVVIGIVFSVGVVVVTKVIHTLIFGLVILTKRALEKI